MTFDSKVSFCASLGLHAAVLLGLNPDMFQPPDWGMAFGQGTIEVNLVEGAPAPAPAISRLPRATPKKAAVPNPAPQVKAPEQPSEQPKAPEPTPREPEPQPQPVAEVVRPPEPVTPPPPPEPVAPQVEPVIALPEAVKEITTPAEVSAPSATYEVVSSNEAVPPSAGITTDASAPTTPVQTQSPVSDGGRSDNQSTGMDVGSGAAASKGESPSPAAKGHQGKGEDEIDLSSLGSPGVAWVKDVRYRKNTPPVYPIKAVVNKIQGLVYLIVDIEPNGTPSNVVLHKTSGSHLLDKAAVDAVWRWEFEPAKEGDRYVKSRTRIPIRFELVSRSAASKSK